MSRADPPSSAWPGQGPATGSFVPAPAGSSADSTHDGISPPNLGRVEPNLPTPPGYETLAVLGHGGQSLVFKARHLATDRLVALKMLRDGLLALPEHQTRLRREAEAITRLQHPHVVQIYEVGTHQGQPFLALEYVDGGSLEALRPQLPLSPEAAAGLVLTLAVTMHFVHENGIVHRDLKPANILLSFSDAPRRRALSQTVKKRASGARLNEAIPKITDFGLAKNTEDSTSLTNTGAIMGTTGYMAPEQAAGKTKEATPATDIYALGAILFDLITGGPPFTGSLLEVLEKIRTQPPPPLPPAVPWSLRRICQRCLQKQPSRRYGSAGELAEELRRFAAQPSTALIDLSDSTEPGLVGSFAGQPGQITGLAFAGAGEQLWSTGSESGEVFCWNVRSGVIERTLTGHVSGVRSFACSLDETWMLTCTPNGSLRLFDLRTEQCVQRFDQLPAPVTSMAFAPAMPWAATGDKQGELRLWDIPGRIPLVRLRGHVGEIRAVAFSPDGKFLATGGEDGAVRLKKANSGTSVTPAGGSYAIRRKYPIQHLCFSPDSTLLAFCNATEVIHVWDVASGQPFQECLGHQSSVADIAFSADGRFLLSVGHDRTLRLWSVATGQESHRFDHEADEFCCIAVSPDGRHVATGSVAGAIRLWRLPEV